MKTLRVEPMALAAALLDYVSEVDHARERNREVGARHREHSSGDRVRRGAITKTGNAHLRRILVEAAWSYRHRPKVGAQLRRRQGNASEEVKEMAWKAARPLPALLHREKKRQREAC